MHNVEALNKKSAETIKITSISMTEYEKYPLLIFL